MLKRTDTIVVYCPNWVGDVVMATPFFECLRFNYPEARIVAVIREYARGVIEDSPWFDDIIGCHDKTTAGFFELVRSLRRLKPDAAILLPDSFRSALISKIGGTKRIFGYIRDGRALIITGGPEPLREGNEIIPVPMAEYYMEILRWLGLKETGRTKPKLFFSNDVQHKADTLLERYDVRPDDMVIGLNPGAKYGSSKCWPADYFAKLAEMLQEKWNCKILLFAGPGEEDIAGSIVSSSKADIINTGPDKVNLSLLKPLVRRCRLLITNDTGPRHYAVAFNEPVVVMMGPSDPRYTAVNLEKTLVLRHEPECFPCHKKQCPEQHECMRDITPEEVFEGSRKMLEKF